MNNITTTSHVKVNALRKLCEHVVHSMCTRGIGESEIAHNILRMIVVYEDESLFPIPTKCYEILLNC